MRKLPSPSLVTRGWSSTRYSPFLSGRRSRGTEPEWLIRRVLHRAGARYRVDARLPGGYRGDIVFARARVAVLVDGCFWHGCPVHGRTEFRGPNRDLWRAKIRRNRARDRRATRLLEQSGWRVLRFWECEVRSAVAASAGRVLAVLDAAGGANRPNVSG